MSEAQPPEFKVVQVGRIEPLYVPLHQAPDACGLSLPTLWRACREGALPSFKAGGRRLIKLADLRDWVEAGAIIPPSKRAKS
jgi:excisionase family DNA binding protein